jgi:hypothetical protein
MESSMDSLDGNTTSGPTSEEKITWESEKVQAIDEACRWRNLDQLRGLAESKGGFLTDDLRQQACMSPPCMMGEAVRFDKL